MSALEKENTTIFITKKKINNLAIELGKDNLEVRQSFAFILHLRLIELNDVREKSN